MTYPPITVSRAGSFVFGEPGQLTITGWTFNLNGRPVEPGENAFEKYQLDIIVAAWHYLNEHFERHLGITVIRTGSEDLQLVDATIELDAQRETAALLERVAHP
ncbi:conserved hypothetical protein [Cupriavidus taiwanensis]|uniref:hypothetical protein n=1 Tax=Cupriavidus taiwanensis TaxID=164546 RepID=UPI000E12793B|nr:hypothetical protein [Cupriavidus taiwanensis]SPA25919.1 conserved hypothetical protein [Cupriavidus taiwanensis]